jgi:hypothetical protein
MLTNEELPLDPQRPIIDPHLHLWEIMPAPGAMQAPQRFLLNDLVEMVGGSGHNITHSVFVECHAMYRRDGSINLRSLGETEFANGVAAMSASGNYGPCRVAHRIVGNVDLCLGTQVARQREASAENMPVGHTQKPCEPVQSPFSDGSGFTDGSYFLDRSTADSGVRVGPEIQDQPLDRGGDCRAGLGSG